MSEQYDPDESDLRMTEIDLERPLGAFDDWIEQSKIEHRSMMLGNILAGAIIAAAVIVILMVLAR